MTKGTLQLMLLAAAVWTGTLSAAETPAAPANAPADPEAREARHGGMRAGRFLETLKEKFPKELAEIEEMRKNDPRAAMGKMRELMKKAGVEMPRRRRRGGESGGDERMTAWRNAFELLKTKDADACAKIEELLKTDPVKALEELKKLAEKHQVKLPEGLSVVRKISPRNENRNYVDRARILLKRTHAQELAQIDELKKTDPNAARDAFRKLVASAGITLTQLRDFREEDPESRFVEILDPADEELLNQNPGSRRNNTGAGFGFGGGGFGRRFGGPPSGFGGR